MTEVDVPACWSRDIRIDRNRARQLLAREATGIIEIDQRGSRAVLPDGSTALFATGPASVPSGGRALKVPRAALGDAQTIAGSDLTWIGDREIGLPEDVIASYDDAFRFVREDPERERPGMRIPQIGAVHAVLGHWTTSASTPGTIVMPTGTGKTETMVALTIAAQPDRLLVIVPSDALRTQIASKFETLGVLPEVGAVSDTAVMPVVGQLAHKFSTPEAALDFASACNVVVTTPGALFASSPETYHAFLAAFSHLFVDEAHHVEAATWRRIRDEFEGKPVLQFTATPYREDGRHLIGKLVYSYPLRAAQAEGYFSSINYVSVVDFEAPDRAIAERAIHQLRQDLQDNRDHLVMARVRRKGRADDIRDLYEELAPDLAPVALYSGMSAADRSAALGAIRSRTSRIIVCVDMLGEGFDLPALKIAAIHDAHKSLGITLQFVGRFARVSGEAIGDATVVVGRPDLDYDSTLRQLYAEDADWNLIVRDLSEGAVTQQEDISEFESGFGSLPEDVSLRNLVPKMSTVVYRTSSRTWEPEQINDLYDEEELLTVPIAINQEAHVAWFVSEVRSAVRWGDLHTVEEVAYHLFVLYWDASQQLLYVNSSNNKSTHEALAKAVCGDDATRITGEEVYRVMARVKRRVPTNIGLLDIHKRSRRFTMHVGADVTEGFPRAEAQTKTKTNIFANGYEDGERVSIGASLKGRIWSYRVAPTLKHWMDWCDHIGTKLKDSSIDLDEVMEGFVRPELLEARPELVPLAIEWGWESLAGAGQGTQVAVGAQSTLFIDTDLEITTRATTGPIGFRISGPDFSADYTLDIDDGSIRIAPVSTEAEIVTARSRTVLSQYLTKYPPVVIFEQEALLTAPAFLLRPNRDVTPIDVTHIRPLDWSTIDISREIQGEDRDPSSVQAHAIKDVLAQAQWDVVLDDHGSGEIADVVALRRNGDDLVISLTHCKSSNAVPGARVGDLYELLGQAQKSAKWKRRPERTLQRLIKREQSRVQAGRRSGFEKGDAAALYALLDQVALLRPVLEVTVVQPGLSKAQLSEAQSELLGATDLYLHETATASFRILSSD